MADCIFCRIAAGAVPATVVAEDDEVIAIEDVAPQAPVHVLVIPRRHVADIREVGEDGLLQRVVATANRVAQLKGVDDAGYRLVVNVGADGGQTVLHLHLHVLGGRRLTWPPG
ncbi:MAG TPA: histidine triad nucleotide-binding protein [Candidatus Dormibacteraeota bacterium]